MVAEIIDNNLIQNDMTKKLLRYIAYMCLFLTLGAINWVVAPLTSKLWILILDVVAAAICFFMAYICYRRARKIAEVIDDNLLSIHRQLGNYLLLFKIIFNGEESESKGQEQGESKAETACNDESEDEFTHTI